MIPYCWIFICGIIFISVDSKPDIAPHQKEPLKKLLKRTLNHMKVFLGEFEEKIRHSRLLVNEIHNQSLLNLTSTKENVDNTSPTPSTRFIRYLNNPFVHRAQEMSPDIDIASRIKSNCTDKKLTVSTIPDVSHLNKILRRMASTITNPKKISHADLPMFRFQIKSIPTNLFFGEVATPTTRNQKGFHRVDPIVRTEEKSSIHQDLINSDTKQGINDNVLLRRTAVVDSNATTKQQKRFTSYGPNKIQLKEVYNTAQRLIYKHILSSVTGNNTVSYNKYPKRLTLKRPARLLFQNNLNYQRGFLKPELIFKDFTTTERKTVNITKYPEPVMRVKQDSQIDILPSIAQASEKQNFHPTLSKFYFQLKQDLFSKLDYPDIFSRRVSTKAETVTATRPVSPKEKKLIFTTTFATKSKTGVIPELTKDYLNMHFRASSSDEGIIELNKPNLREKNNSAESRRTIALPEYSAVKKRKNENLRKIIAASSYSLSDEETYLKVNFLDQLYHYNKTLKR